MNLHILFAPVQATDDVAVPPTAAMPLTLDEETQYRCAGFVQAEIERYAELLHGGNLRRDQEQGSDGEGSSEDEQDADAALEKKKQGAEKAQEGNFTFLNLIRGHLQYFRRTGFADGSGARIFICRRDGCASDSTVHW